MGGRTNRGLNPNNKQIYTNIAEKTLWHHITYHTSQVHISY